MKLRNVFLVTMLSSFFFVGCNDDDNKEKGKFDGKPIRFDTQIGSQTRASGTEWGNEDAIGVYMKDAGAVLSATSAQAENSKYTTTGNGAFVHATPADAIYFPEDGSNVDFIAYYPYKTTITNFLFPINVGGDQTGKLPKIDLLYSDNLINKNNSSNDAILGFTHQMATIVLNIEDKGGNNLAGMTVTLTGMKTNADFSLIDATFIDDGTINDIIAETKVNNAEATAQAIIIPIKSLTGAKIKFAVPAYGKTFTWDIPTRDFDGKNKYTYDVEIKQDGGLTVLNPNSNITDWVDNPGGTIEIGDGGEAGGDGTQTNPYTIEQISSKVGETGKWVEGFIVGSTIKQRVVGTPNTDNILIAATADETDEAKCIPVDIASSAVKSNLDIVANPELIGKKVKLQGDIVDNIFENTLSLTNITAQEGGVTVTPNPGGDLEFLETFGETWRTAAGTISKTIADYISEDRFDMKSPIVYSLTEGTEPNRLDVRATNGYDNPHLWFAANNNTGFKISGIESGYTAMTLTYDIACNAASKPFSGIMVQCNGVDVTIPDGTTSSTTNTFSEITFAIPDNTTEIIFYATAESNPTGSGYRIDNIKITGSK